MADKEFQVRHGLIVNNTVLVANSITNNVGIGRANPGYALDVVGTANASNLLINGSPVSLASATDAAFNKANAAYLTANIANTTANTITFTKLLDVPNSYTGFANSFVTVKSDQTGLEFTTNVTISGLQFYPQNTPSTPANDVMEMYLTASGNSPNRIVALKVLNQLGEEIIVSSILT